MTAELLELLLPDRSPGAPLADRDRRALAAIQLARLLAGLGTGASAGRVDLDLGRAGADLDARLAAEALERCEALFAAHLDRARVGDPFALVTWPEPVAPAERATWAGLVKLAGRVDGMPLPGLPEPAEAAGAVARRLLHAATCLGLTPARAELWRALLEHDEGDHAVAEERLSTLIEGQELDHDTRVAATSALLGALLERGAVHRARDLALAHLDLAAAAPELQRRAAWACLVGGEPELTTELALPTPARHLPPVLVALGRRRPELRTDLTGGASWDPAPERSSARTFRRGRRAEVGASLLALFRLEGGLSELRHLEAAPGLEAGARTEDWVEERCLAPGDAAEAEHAALAAGIPVVAFPSDESAVGRRLGRSCLTQTARALALVPVVVETGATLGWLRLEFEHELVPSEADLQALAAGLARRFGLTREGRAARRAEALPAQSELAARIEPRLGSLARRRWWVLSAEELVLASGGQALADPEFGGSGLLAEARTAGAGRVLARVDDPSASYHARAGSALVLPLGPGWSPATSWLVVESTTPGDLGGDHLARWSSELTQAAAWLQLQRFGAWHRTQRGEPLHLDPAPLDPPGTDPTASGGLGTGELLARLSRVPGRTWLVHGSAGSGRGLVGRLALFLQLGSGGAEPRCLSLRGLDPGRLEAQLEAPGALVLEDLEHLDDSGRAALGAALGRDRTGPLVLLSTEAPDRDLAGALDGRVLHLADLTERRRELPGVLRALLRREAVAASALPPVLGPELEHRIWRTDLDLGGLTFLARRLVELRPGGELEPGDLELVLEAERRPPRRLPSKRPDPRALWAALDGTRKSGGSFHRRRAAALLGWDPDTVSARIRDLGWEDLG